MRDGRVITLSAGRAGRLNGLLHYRKDALIRRPAIGRMLANIMFRFAAPRPRIFFTPPLITG